MSYTILSARYANEDHSAAVVMTQEAAAVLVSLKDTPDLWAALGAWGAPEPFQPPADPIPTITRRQFRLWLFSHGKTIDEVRAVIEALPEPQRSIGLIELEDAGTFERGHAMFDLIGPQLGFGPADMDQAFREAALL